MNKKYDNPTDPVMRHLIDLYFDGETTLEQEMTLRRILATSDADDPETEAARAVLGVFATARKLDRRASTPVRRRRRFAPVMTAVASVAVLLVSTIALSGTTEASETGKCYATVGGRLINERSQIEAIVTADFESIADASRMIDSSITDDLSAISQSLDTALIP